MLFRKYLEIYANVLKEHNREKQHYLHAKIDIYILVIYQFYECQNARPIFGILKIRI